MSDKTPTTQTVAAKSEEIAEQVAVKKQSLVAKTRTSFQKHKQTILAGGALAALVGVSAYVGRASASHTTINYSVDTLELEGVDVSMEVESDTTNVNLDD